MSTIETNYVVKASEINSEKELITFLNSDSYKIISNKKEIINKVVLANFFSKQLDRSNPKSLQLYKDALKLSSDIKDKNFLIWFYTSFGFYYYTYNDYPNALPLFLKTSKLLENNHDKDIIDSCNILKLNGFFWSTIEDNNKSNEYLERALQQCSTNNQNYGTILNNIALNYIKLNNFQKALTYLEKTKAAAVNINDKVRYAKALGDIALIEATRKNYDKAVNLLKEDIAISDKENSDRNKMFAEIRLATIYIDMKRYEDAKKLCNDALDYIKTKTYLASYELDIQRLLLKISINDKNDNAELYARRRIESLNNQIILQDGVEAVKMANWQSQKERVEWQLEAEQNKAEKSKVIKWFLLAVSLLLCGLVASIYQLNKRKIRLLKSSFEKQILKFKLDQVESDKKLQSTNTSLASFKAYLVDRNKHIDKIDTEISKLRETGRSTKTLSAMEELKISHLVTDENWNKFKEVFIREEPEYYQYIINSFPGLTESNLRIILLNRLDLNNIEIAQLLGLSVDGVKKSKQRLRKKFDNDDTFVI
ncbi:tetratricopeptide repeat protein [Soonwooa sp.]|uniref:tetratricopeptide repeat protein n=1 Tax=Soonwooa sp. TaxID=1938592 RepID=UPI00289BAB31|nr:tetratricopeptide repeat protein [Soonwooa sp.]